MDFANPTPLKIGTVGMLFGQQFRVVGRVVMGMDQDGETYYWNEFNILNSQNQFATLVYEESERGGEWRLFTLIEPKSPLTATAAATRRVGDVVNLDGTPMPVTLVDESRVYHIEGEAPEGVEVGDIAHYFNAEAGDQMLVASWTGDDIEFYRGVDLSPGLMATAFNLPAENPVSYPSAAAAGAPYAKLARNLVTLFLLIVFGLVVYSSFRPGRGQAAAPRVPPAPASPLMVASAGKLGDKTWRIRCHAVVEIAQVGLIYQRHEYELTNEDGTTALLVCGLKPDAKDWALFTPLEPAVSITPYQAAAVRMGETMNVNGSATTVADLFESTVRQVEPAESSAQKTGDVFYGFDARSASTLYLARWNESGITLYSGEPLPAKTVTVAFRQEAK